MPVIPFSLSEQVKKARIVITKELTVNVFRLSVTGCMVYSALLAPFSLYALLAVPVFMACFIVATKENL